MYNEIFHSEFIIYEPPIFKVTLISNQATFFYHRSFILFKQTIHSSTMVVHHSLFLTSRHISHICFVFYDLYDVFCG